VTRETYRASLRALRTDVVEMGDLVANRLDLGLEALRTGDEDLAHTVIDGDEAVNETYLALEKRCLDLLALQQPVAGDLRFIAASFKVITDLERVGDLATNLAGHALAGERDPVSEVAVEDIGDLACDLLDDSVAAYREDDVDLARAVAERDDELDALCLRASETVARDLIEHEAGGDDPWAVERLLDDVSRLLLTIRDLERVGDHAVNIAARTLYMVENDPELVY
jgi:phosphate transport system protein